MTLPATDDAPLRRATVFVIDPDVESRSSITALVNGLKGVQVMAFTSAEDFLAYPRVGGSVCVISDVHLPGIDGLELQRRLLERNGPRIPMLFVGGHGDIRSAVQAVRLGAIDFIEKPVVGRVLLRAVQGALRSPAQRNREGYE